MLVRVAISAVVLVAIAHAAFAGPTSPYYLAAGDEGTNWTVQGNAVTNTWGQQHATGLGGGEYAIAVAATVRTLFNGNVATAGPTYLGSEYTLGGAYTGVDYPYPANNAAFYDGTTDGTYNYTVDFFFGDVYRMDSDWSNPALLFSVPDTSLGITYDSTNGSLWISTWNNTTVSNYTTGGTFLSSFNVPFGSITCLALDPADDTLWMGTQGSFGTFYQYSKAGALLDTVYYAAVGSQNTLGGEFAVPEPSAGLLSCVGLMAYLAARRLWTRPE